MILQLVRIPEKRHFEVYLENKNIGRVEVKREVTLGK